MTERLREVLLQQEADRDGFISVAVLSDVDRNLVRKARKKGECKQEPKQ